MKTKKVNLRTILRVSETNTKFGLVKRIAYVQGSNKNEAHFVHTSNADNTCIVIKRIPRWHRASI
jgi:hypothetical protein